MSYRITLSISHALAAIVAALAVWYSGYDAKVSSVATAVICVVGVASTAGLTVRWLARGLKRMETALASVGVAPLMPGISEFDQTTNRLRETFAAQHTLVRDVQNLLDRLNPEVTVGEGSSAADSGTLRTTLSRIVRSAAKDVGRILTFGDDIAQGANDAHWGAQEQARTVARTIESVEQLSGNIDLVANNAEAASTSASEVSDAAAKGLELVRELIRGMDRIRANVEVGEKKVLSLGERSQEIGSIVETMTAISSRADILALNASIEAVRAGQEGRGFAVVADEVRKLAERTANASREIAALVESIQLETRDTISTMADERSQVQQEVLRVNQAGVTLELISRTSTDSADRVREISQTTTDQLRGTQSIVQAMQQMAEFSERIQERAKGIRYTTTDLVAAAQDLEERLSPMFHFDRSDDTSSKSHATVSRTTGRDALNEPDFAADDLVSAVEQGDFSR